MQSETINANNFSTIELDGNYFKFCNFEDLSPEGGLIDSDFRSCSFKNIDWYWGAFNDCNFMKCQFTNCIFRGTHFWDCRFVECTLTNCQFLKDNLNSVGSLNTTIMYECSVEDCVGIEPAIRR